MGYPVAGLAVISPAGGTFAAGNVGYRFFQAYGQLEYRMNNLGPDEEARLVGAAYAAIALTGPQPSPGDTVSVVLSGGPIASPQTLTAVMPATPAGQDGRLLLTALLAQQCAENAVLQAAGMIGVQPFGTGQYAQNTVPTPEVAFIGPAAFTITARGTGTQYPIITASGALIGPSSSLDGINTIYGYLPILDGLEGAWASASQNLDTIQADVWRGRANEAGARYSLYRVWQGQLADFLGIPMASMAKNRPAQHGAMRYA